MLGKVLEVSTVARGSYATVDHAAGATTLYVQDGSDFDAAGTLTVLDATGAEVAVTYTRVDDVLTVEPLPVAVGEDAPVLVAPAASDMVAQVMVDPVGTEGETEPVEAVVQHSLRAFLADGIRRTPDVQETAVVELVDGVWTVTDVPGVAPTILADALPPLPGVEQVVYYSPEPPVLTADDAGKVWYDTDGGMAVSRWDGTAWVAAPIGSVAMTETLVGKTLIGGEVHAPTIYMGDVGARMVLVNTAPEGVAGASQRILGYTGYEAEMPAEIYFRGYVDGSRTVGQTFVGSPRFDSSGFARLLLESRDDGTSKATLGADMVSVDSPWGFSAFRTDKVVTSRVQTPSGMAIISTSKTLKGGSPGSYLSGLTVVEGTMIDSTGVITVPEDLNIDEQHRVRIEANVCLASSATRAYIEILDAADAIIPGGRVEAGNATATYKTLDIGRSIPCWAGDTFRVRVYCAATTTMQGATVPVLLQAWME